MTVSTSEARAANLPVKLAVPFAFAIVVSGAALWQGRLNAGAVFFLAMTLCLVIIRMLVTRGAPLPVRSVFFPAREKCLVTLVGVGMMWLPILMIATPVLDVASYDPPSAVRLLGLILAAAGLWLFWRSHVDLGAYWSPVLEIREEHVLISDGVYRRVRHPMYAALVLITAAQACFLHNWIAGPAGLITFLILYRVRVRPEEAMMEQSFGDAYRDYYSRTGRLVPKIKL